MTRAVIAWALKKSGQGHSVAIATIIQSKGSVPGKPGAKLALIESGEKFGTIGGAGLELKVEKMLHEVISQSGNMPSKGGRIERFLLHKDGKGKEVTPLDSLCGGQVTIALEVLDSVPHILIVGGGHVGKSISLVSDTLGWSHSVFDIRSEYSNHNRFPSAEDTYSSTVQDFINSEDSHSLSRFSDILLLGHDWSADQEMLIGLLSKIENPLRPRLGAIGSKAKWSAFRVAAQSANIPQSNIDMVRCPIGLLIGAHSPEEIAIAVCAEIISMEKQNINSEG